MVCEFGRIRTIRLQRKVTRNIARLKLVRWLGTGDWGLAATAVEKFCMGHPYAQSLNFRTSFSKPTGGGGAGFIGMLTPGPANAKTPDSEISTA